MFSRIVGTHNTANEVFHCVHFEAPAMADLQVFMNLSYLPVSVYVCICLSVCMSASACLCVCLRLGCYYYCYQSPYSQRIMSCRQCYVKLQPLTRAWLVSLPVLTYLSAYLVFISIPCTQHLIIFILESKNGLNLFSGWPVY